MARWRRPGLGETRGFTLELIDYLSGAAREGKLRHVLPTYTNPHVLVIDEVGYLSYGPDAANVLFQIVNDRHLHRRPMIFTTNKPLGVWGRVLHDPDLAEGILDRVLKRGRHLELCRPSYRTRHLRPRPASRVTIPGSGQNVRNPHQESGHSRRREPGIC